MKTRASAFVALIAAAALLAGCVPEPEQSASPSATASPAPSATETSTTPSPSAAPEDPDDPATWIVTQDGIGPLRLDDPFDDARALLPAGSEYDPSACFWAAWWNSTDMETQVYVVGESADGSEEVGPVLLVASSAYQAEGLVGPRTVDGLGAGSTADEIRAVHPDAVEVEGTIDGTFLQVDRIFFSFRTDSPHASAVTVTTLPEPPYEVCG